MKSKSSNQEWILLIHQLPPQPTNLRVRIWRKLQRLGAVAIKNSVYVLPFNEKTHEDFQWLKQEIESSSGEATVFRAGAVEGATDAEIISRPGESAHTKPISTGCTRNSSASSQLISSAPRAVRPPWPLMNGATRLFAPRKTATSDWRNQAPRKARRPICRNIRDGFG